MFPMELFTKYFQKLKTTFGHKILEEELAEDFDESEAFCNFIFISTLLKIQVQFSI